MGDLVDLTQWRQDRKQQAPTVTWATIIAESLDFLLTEWEKLARHNRLNDYFKRQLSNTIEFASKANYMADLNEVALLELKLDVFPMIFFPGTMNDKQLGWVVRFKLGSETIATPELANEAYARCFALLLHLKIKHAALVAGLLK
jgi:hypothetical protein